MWGSAVFIILVFMVLALNATMSVGIKTVQENWGEYRCNPMVMPFAASLAPFKTSAGENFSYCISQFAANAAPSIIAPLHYVQSMTLNVMQSMIQSNQNSMAQSSSFSAGVSSMFGSIYNVMIGVVVEFKILTLKLIDAQNKIIGIMTTIMYIITATQYSFISMWKGPPGLLLRGAEKLASKR